MTTKTLKIGGMSCGHCVAGVKAALEAVPGAEVLDVRVGSAAVRFDGTRTPAAALTDAVVAAGYFVESAADAAPTLAAGCGCGCGPR